MRTTLINTDFWKENEIDELHLDSKLLYLFMLTNPDKGLANIYIYKPKVMSAYSGLSVDQISVAIKQLISLGYIAIKDNYYSLVKGHEMPKRGRFTEQTIAKERASVPESVLSYFDLINSGDSSGVAPEHNTITKDKDNTKTKAIAKIVNKEAIESTELLASLILKNYEWVKITEANKQTWSQDIEKINRIDGHHYSMINEVIRWSQSDSFWNKNIRSGAKLRDKFEKLRIDATSTRSSSKMVVL